MAHPGVLLKAASKAVAAADTSLAAATAVAKVVARATADRRVVKVVASSGKLLDILFCGLVLLR